MTKCKTVNGLRFLKPFYITLSIFGLAPCYSFEEKKLKHECLHKIYCLFVTFLILSTCVFCAYTKYSFDDYKRTTELILDFTLNILLIANNIIAIFVSSFRYRKLWVTILNAFCEFDNNTKYVRKLSRYFYLGFGCQHAIVLAVLVVDTFVGMSNSWTDYLYYGLERLRLYFVFLPVISISYLAISLKERFKFLNDKLVNMYWNNSLSFKLLACDQGVVKSDAVHTFNYVEEIRSIHQNYSILSSIVNLCNNIFGIQILLLFGIIVAGELNSINIILLYDAKKGNNFNWANLTLNLLVTLMLLSWGYAVIHFGGSANYEAYKTSSICYQLSSELSDEARDYKKLVVLAQHASDRCPQLSAASVFTINLAAFFAILGSLTSYVIVLIQFDK